MESAGKGAAIYRKNRAVIAWKKTNERVSLVNSLCRQRTGLKVLDGKESGLGQE